MHVILNAMIYRQMKKLFLFLLLAFAFYIGKAQSPVIDSTWLPSAGDSFSTYIISPYSTIHNQGYRYGNNPVVTDDTGANVTWDFNSANYYKDYVFEDIAFTDLASKHIRCIFSSANLATGNDSNHFRCFIKNNNGVSMLQLRNSNIDYFGVSNKYYPKPWPFMKSNFHFHQESFDTSLLYFYSNGTPGDTPYRGIAPFHFKYDGYGKLKVLGYEFDSVVRVHIVHWEEDTIRKDNNLHEVSRNEKDYYDEYDWYTSSVHYPVLRMYTHWIIDLIGKDTVRPEDLAYLTLTKKQAAIATSPDRISHSVSAGFDGDDILIRGLDQGRANFTLYNTTGQALFKQDNIVSSDGAIAKLNTAGLPPGMYILYTKGSTGQIQSIKLVKEE